MRCRIEQLNRDTTKHFIFKNDILASAVGAVRGAVLSTIHYLQNIKGSHGNAMGLSDYSVGIIIVESEGHAPVKSGTVQKACTHLLGHCFGRHAEVAAQRIRLLGRSRQSHDVQFSCAIYQPLLAHHWRVHQCLLTLRFIAPPIPWGVSAPGGKMWKQLLKDRNFLNTSPIFTIEISTIIHLLFKKHCIQYISI